MSINKNGKKVKSKREELKPELISWDEPTKAPNTSSEFSLELLKSKYISHVLAAVGLLAGGSFFFLGRMSAPKEVQDPLSVKYQNYVETESQVASVAGTNSLTTKTSAPKPSPTQKVILAPNTNGEVIGSKSGKKYYFPWCGTVKRIKPENQVHFVSIAAAKAAGFTPGGNCKGIY